ncbi:MAG: hypothetical protein RIQ60_4092 [Pseudomonadota bacterium]|jgi:uncharacterized protein (TIGR00369 family)
MSHSPSGAYAATLAHLELADLLPPPDGSSPDTVATTVARWQAEEAERRKHLAPAGISRPEQVAGLSGLEIFQAISAGQLPSVPIGATVDMWPIGCGPGWFVFQGRPDARFFNPMGTIHGGWIATLLDSALGCCVQTTVPAGGTYTTAELKVSYLRALTPAVPLVRAVGQVINAGRRLGFAEARLLGPDGKVYAHATTTCLIMERAGR